MTTHQLDAFAVNARPLVEALDDARISTQRERVLAYCLNTGWHTLSEIQRECGGSEAGISARLRDLRKAQYGGFQVDRQRVEGSNGLWRYRVSR